MSAKRRFLLSTVLLSGSCAQVLAQTAPALAQFGNSRQPERARNNARATFTQYTPPEKSARETAVPFQQIAPLPVREVTIFKDGHAFVLQEGEMPVANGEIVLDDLPVPVLGTFWAYANGAKLNSVTASRQLVSFERNAQSLRDLLQANIGAQISVREDNKRYDATILSVPSGSHGVLLYLSNSGSSTPSPPQIILLQTRDGVRVVPIDSLTDVIFKNALKPSRPGQEYRNLLRLQLDGAPARATVGLTYLQRGIRWIPSYRIALDGKGGANVKMQAALVNDLIDLNKVTANLVIGVPSFAFQDSIDPIALQYTPQQLSPFFGTDSRNALSNAIQGQFGGGFGGSGNYNLARNENVEVSGPELGEGTKNEDFFLFPVKNITLAKGERMIFPIAQYDLQYQDIFTSEAPPAPPAELYRGFSAEQQKTIADKLTQANVLHKIRLTNTGQQPLTTAPTLIESDGRVLAQTLMTYTATGGRSDLDLAPAVDVTVKRRENETRRTPDALKVDGANYQRVDVEGSFTVTSYRDAPLTLELTRQFAGEVDAASDAGAIRKVGVGDDDNALQKPDLPFWWNYGNGWRGLNGLGEVKWTLEVPAKKSVELTYQYHYFWR